MNVALILFVLGVMMVVAGFTNQISPTCNSGVEVKIVPRGVYDEILRNQDLTDQVFKDMSEVTTVN